MLQVIGEAKSHAMYMCGGDVLSPGVESLAGVPEEELGEEDKPPAMPLLVTLQSIAGETEVSPAQREIFAGCAKSMAVGQKKVNSTNTVCEYVALVHRHF